MNQLKFALVLLALTSCGLKEAKRRDEENVKKLIAERGPELNRCYEAALQKDPDLDSGTITVRADQHIDGSLHSARMIKGFSASNRILDCVTESINSWKTDAPSTRGPINITWNFKNPGPSISQAQSDFETELRKHEEDFKSCYKQYVRSERAPEWGKIRFEFLRGQNGRISQLRKIAGFKGSDQIFACMTRIMESWQLAEGHSSQRLTWSYQFRPDFN